MNFPKHSAICVTAILMLAPTSSFAGSNIGDVSVSACTTINCSTLSIPGDVISVPTLGFAGNFLINAYASPGECVRFDLVTPTNPDMKLVVIAPNGTVYRNDDRSGADHRPLVTIPSAPNDGWYTVHISEFSGAAITTNFELKYGRYNFGNPNCSTATPPL